MKQTHRRILSEAFLPDVWKLVIRFLNSSKGASLVVLASMFAIQYIGPGPFVVIAGILEMGFDGNYLESMLKKHIRHGAIKEELIPIADAVVTEIARDGHVKAQVSKIRNFIRDLKASPPTNKEAVVTASKNLKTEMMNSEKIVSVAIDKALKSSEIDDLASNIPNDTIYIKRVIMRALSISTYELKALLQH